VISKIWKDPVWSKIIAAGLLVLFVWAADYFFDALSFLAKVLKFVWADVCSSTVLPNWLFLIMVVSTGLVLLMTLLYLKEAIFNQNIDEELYVVELKGKARSLQN